MRKDKKGKPLPKQKTHNIKLNSHDKQAIGILLFWSIFQFNPETNDY